MQILIASIIGLVSGVASGLFGVGGGIVMVPAMVFLLSPPIRDIKQAVGTSLVVIIPTALMGSYKHFTQGNIEWRIAAALAPLAIAGSYLGAWLTVHIPADNLKRAFGGFIILVGAKLLFFK
ncbi:MAG TPA: sulfite exporter TauE/SafE family protein [Verrucomicrobiae bacterium]|nr:sulfite exporter TauE/SafE family protein [Verrucomicrobiae bacterium]